MKINDLKDPSISSQMIQTYQKGDNLNQPVDKQAGAAATEKVDISSQAKDIQKAKTIIDNLPDVRDAKVQELKTQIEQGSYKVNSGKVAEKMVHTSLIDIFS